MTYYKHRQVIFGLAIVTTILSIAVFAPSVTNYDPVQMDMANRLSRPNAAHWLGTDNFGRDLWTRMAYGARISLGIGFAAIGLAAMIGVIVGLAAGYFKGWVDLTLMRVVDLFLGFPPIILALAVVAILGPGAVNLIVALTAVMWTQFARVMRSIAGAESERDYVTASRALGFSPARILLRQVMPNTIGPIAVLAALGIGTAIVAESGMSFLGFGVQPPTPTWGWTLAYGVRYLRSAAWLSIVPGLFIMGTVMGFNLLGDGLRDLLDPRRRVSVTPLSNR